MKLRNDCKTKFVTQPDLYIYLQIDQELIRASHTYYQFCNIIFDYLPKINKVLAQANFIEDYGNREFSLFIDNDIGAAIFLKLCSIFYIITIFLISYLD